MIDWLILWPTDESPWICSIMTRVSVATSWKNHKRRTVRLLTRLLHNRLALELTSVWRDVLFFPVSASIVSKRLLWLNKQKVGDYRRGNLGREVQKHTRSYRFIAVGAAKDNEIKNLWNYNLKIRLILGKNSQASIINLASPLQVSTFKCWTH